MPSVFFSYSHADEQLRDQLEKQLSLLKRQGIIETWHDRRIGAGQDFAKEIDQHVDTDDIILLLVSADFLDSDYCYDREMKRAMERHEAGEAIVIPVILRACDWHGAPFGKLNAAPPNGRPVTQYPDRDQALLEVARAVRSATERLTGRTQPTKGLLPLIRPEPPAASTASPRSSNLRLAKTFSERDKDRFRDETFTFMQKFFANSLGELEARNPGIKSDFRIIDANRFTAKIYRNGQSIAQCTIFMGGRMLGDGIAYSQSGAAETNSFNEQLSVEADDQTLFLRPLGMAFGRQRESSKLSPEGAAEFYWEMLIYHLQER